MLCKGYILLLSWPQGLFLSQSILNQSACSFTLPTFLTLTRELCLFAQRSSHATCRALRLVLFGFFGVSASVGALIATTQVIAALGGAERALPLADVAQSLGIDLAAAGVFAFFLRRDLQVHTCADMCAGMCLRGTVCLREPTQLLLQLQMLKQSLRCAQPAGKPRVTVRM